MNEKGFSLIESVTAIMLSSVIIMGLQVSIGNIIRSSVQNNTAITITDFFNTISHKIQNKCAGSSEAECRKIIDIDKYNKTDKFKINIMPDDRGEERGYEILAIYFRSENEYGSIEPLVKRTASIYGYPDGDNIVSVLGEWTVSLKKYEQFQSESNGKTAYYFYKKALF
ncbi:type IV pilus modification PilV family protein [Escherichia coli]|uniref:type IV pilus modification PilV family protein n=1 Tax=Escherichia coli TaxID=562 RepID=UPI000BE1E51A|nr:hypothetical protein [Escherichia coli]